MAKIILAADHGGWACKNKARHWLIALGYQVEDAGAFKLQASDDFPDYALAAVKLWRREPTAKIICWCRSGAGMLVQLNRFAGIRASLALGAKHLAASVRDDHLNALVLASDYQLLRQQQQLIKVFLQTPYGEESKYYRRLHKIEEFAKL